MYSYTITAAGAIMIDSLQLRGAVATISATTAATASAATSSAATASAAKASAATASAATASAVPASAASTASVAATACVTAYARQCQRYDIVTETENNAQSSFNEASIQQSVMSCQHIHTNTQSRQPPGYVRSI